MNTLLHYEIYNAPNTKSLYCIHGWGYTFAFFPGFVKEASRHFRVVTIDLPGYGLSASSGHYQSLQAISLVLDQTLYYMNPLKDDIILAHSMGSLIMASIINNYSQTKVVLNGTPLMTTMPWYGPLMLKHKKLLEGVADSTMLCHLFNNIGQSKISQFNAQHARQKYHGDADAKTVFLNSAAILENPTEKYISHIKNFPHVRFTYGEYDENRKLADVYTVPYTTIPVAGHSAMQDNPDAYVKYLESLY